MFLRFVHRKSKNLLSLVPFSIIFLVEFCVTIYKINRKDFEACLRNAVSTLSEKNQHYVHLLEEGESNSTIAELEGCTPNAVAKRIWVIRKTLKGNIKGIAEEFNLPADNLAC